MTPLMRAVFISLRQRQTSWRKTGGGSRKREGEEQKIGMREGAKRGLLISWRFPKRRRTVD